MNLENVDTQLSELLEKVRPELTPALTDRATAAIRAARPLPIRSRRRPIAVAAGLAVALFALGFVPIPLGRTKGALDRAMAAMRNAPTFYMEYREHSQGQEVLLRQWESAQGYSRWEQWEAGTLVSLYFEGPQIQGWYDAHLHKAHISDRPPRSRSPERFLSMSSEGILMFISAFEKFPRQVSEWRERRLWGRSVDIVQVTVGATRFRLEVDPGTGRMLSWVTYERQGAAWKPVGWTEDVEWDVAVPEGLWTDFTPPKGTEVEMRLWWGPRAGQSLRVAETSDWLVTLNSIDVNRDGDLFVTLSRKERKDEPSYPSKQGYIEADAVDNLGVMYALQGGMYGGSNPTVRRLNRRPAASSALPRVVTLTVYPCVVGDDRGESVTFPQVPLPPRQDREELFKGEIVQY